MSEDLQRQIDEVRVMAEDALDKFPIRSTTTAGAGKERHIHDLGKHPGGVIAARVLNSGNISINDSTLTALTFDSERFDTDSIHSTSSNTERLTCVTAGKYIIVGNFSWASDPNQGEANIRLNGSTKIAGTMAITDYRQIGLTTIYDLAVGDYVELMALQTSGGALNVSAISNYSPEFSMARIGAAGTTGGGVPGTDHGALTGLGDDDHASYLLAAGTRAGSTGTAQDFGSTGITTDVIAESTGAAGVTIDSVLLKDGVVTVGDVAFDDATSDPLIDADAADDGNENSVARKDHVHIKHHAQAHASDHADGTDGTFLPADGSVAGATGAAQDFGSNGIKADVVAESTGATGVNADGVLLKDATVETGTVLAKPRFNLSFQPTGTGDFALILRPPATLSAGHLVTFPDSAGTVVLVETTVEVINFIVDGGGSEISTGLKGDVMVEFACTINQVTMLADQSGSIVVDIWKQAYADFPPEDANSITASAPPTITTDTDSQDSTLTGWTTSISAGDTLRYNCDSVTDIERVTIALKVTRV